MSDTWTFSGHVTPADKQQSDYILIPFDVPPGARRLEVSYAYQRHNGKTVLDLGLFDARGAGFLQGEGFRGWSGSERAHVVITETSATPGYLPGPLLPGTWYVILGVYKVAPQGSEYEVCVHVSDEPGPPPYPPPRASVDDARGKSGPGWLRGDLQCHTHHSDGKASVEELAIVARERALDFVAVTDHNTVSHHPYLLAHAGSDLILIPGEEVTTYYGHANVWGLQEWVDFRCRTSEEVRRAFLWANERGGLVSINHPKPGGPPWEFGYDLPFTCMEVWHGYPHQNHIPLQVWDRLLQAGRQIVAVGGSDVHLPPLPTAREFPLQLGRPTTYVWAEEPSIEGILTGIRLGRVAISCDVDGPRINMRVHSNNAQAAMGGSIVVPPRSRLTVEVDVSGGEGGILDIVHQGHIVESVPVRREALTYTTGVWAEEPGYVRAQVRASENDPRVWSTLPLLALSNPVYILMTQGG